MEIWISFQKAVIELVKNGLCKLCIFSTGSHIVLVANLENHFIKSFFLFAGTDFLIIIINATVFAFLLCVELRQSFIKQLMVRILDRSVAILDVQMGSCRINIFCDIGAAVVSNDTVTGHSTDCSSYSCHLQICGIL